MNNFHPHFNSTSAELEKVAINRFRKLVRVLPSQCHIFRESWELSTVVCLDCSQCPDFLNELSSSEEEIIQAIQQLGLANTVLFRMGNKLIGWKAITSSQST
ncbi:MAG: hypothetical protein ACTMUB_01725 [cyanobacterium endosymbiont of Rhopalodia musculus]|uniref:hypothetical protein n=1 Tax=cyanobacterium endosymbiont of Epithemia clementina EcSB TaxID=3034674 RepID=UPI0024807B80|nr:hypothetical protein [cyanobacterium endosymbiont of Epithemia clementina EcSB]WGT66970.1 hypothetical protein P3F56_06935 [cyanobacterium endosymbiont of Epithemia clementina EcSB]